MAMDTIIKAIGLIFVLIGIAYIIKPAIARWMLRFLNKHGRIYLSAILRFVLAVVFLFGANECEKRWIIAAFGILFLLDGLMTVMLGPSRIKPILEWYDKQSDHLFRFLALIVSIIGSIVIYAA